MTNWTLRVPDHPSSMAWKGQLMVKMDQQWRKRLKKGRKGTRRKKRKERVRDQDARRRVQTWLVGLFSLSLFLGWDSIVSQPRILITRMQTRMAASAFKPKTPESTLLLFFRLFLWCENFKRWKSYKGKRKKTIVLNLIL